MKYAHVVLLLCLAAQPAFGEHGQHGGAKQALTLGAAFAPDGRLWLVRQDPQQGLGLGLLISADDGHSWQNGPALDTAGDQINFNAESNPKLAFGPNGAVVIAYARPLAQRFTGEVRLLRSTDGGQHFAAPVTLHQDRQEIGHGFAALAFDGAGALHALWLDGRDMAAARRAAGSGNDSGKPAYRGSAVYRNVSFDGGASFGPDLKLADSSCECCRIAVTTAADGRVAAMWRQLLAPNIRDHGFAVLDPAHSAPVQPVRATYDNWAVDGCPHHGPALAAALDGSYHALWFGLRDGAARVRYGRLGADGQPSGTVQALPDERAEHADLYSAGTRVAIVWRSFDGQATHLKAWISEDGGAHFSLRELAGTSGDSDYPRLLGKPGPAGAVTQIFVVWNTAERTYVEKL